MLFRQYVLFSKRRAGYGSHVLREPTLLSHLRNARGKQPPAFSMGLCYNKFIR